MPGSGAFSMARAATGFGAGSGGATGAGGGAAQPASSRSQEQGRSVEGTRVFYARAFRRTTSLRLERRGLPRLEHELDAVDPEVELAVARRPLYGHDIGEARGNFHRPVGLYQLLDRNGD